MGLCEPFQKGGEGGLGGGQRPIFSAALVACEPGEGGGRGGARRRGWQICDGGAAPEARPPCTGVINLAGGPHYTGGRVIDPLLPYGDGMKGCSQIFFPPPLPAGTRRVLLCSHSFIFVPSWLARP